MEITANLLHGFQTALTLQNLYLCFIGCLWGTMVGVLPGIGPVAGVALLIPVTFGTDPTGAIIMLAGIYYGAMYGGSITSILMNIPGEAASIVTCFDGYQMTKKGRGGAALFISAWGSWIGGTLSILGLMLLAPYLADIAVKFGPPEMFSVLLMALILMGSLGKGSFFQTMPVILLGLLIGTVGMDRMTGALRFTHEITELYDGIGMLPVAMGAMGVGEVLTACEESLVRIVHKIRLRELFPTRAELRASWGPMFRGSGARLLHRAAARRCARPGEFCLLHHGKKAARRPEEFGTGRIEGVAGPEAANNAATGAAMVPFLSLGIPTNPTTAIMMVALLIHGVRPGPLFISEQPEIFWGLIASMYVGNLILIVLNIPMVGLFVNLLRVPFRLLFPVVLLICLVGTYSVNASRFELGLLLSFGILGYLFRKIGADFSPCILALILGPSLEQTFRQALMRSGGSFAIFVARRSRSPCLSFRCCCCSGISGGVFGRKRPPGKRLSPEGED